ncbi:hypothetical protein SAMN02746065_102250 [Desulfocicer vacuolatum DSM 3385]|uniref:Uncharacterized protein n=1 Tax=Desulfocicer vacuolatum DSM 3385 TaxID=1121400 RepID=A0A1W1ZF69_9BACT|nr:hypothetical protein SAMN02746065_102250 [Desulfocicer vacuolatum DSM 3385]
MGNRNRTIELSTVPVRDHCPSGGGGIIPFSIFVVSGRRCPLNEIRGRSGMYFNLRCGQTEFRIRSAHGSYIKEILLEIYNQGEVYHQKSLSSKVSPVKILPPDTMGGERRVSSRPHRIKRSQDMIQPMKKPCFLKARAA